MTNLDSCDLYNIAKQMVGVSDVDNKIPVGLTYIGQMIAHDLVPPTKPTKQSRLVKPWLNLDSVYGDDLNAAKNLPSLTSDGRFKLTQVNDTCNSLLGYDFHRIKNEKGDVALIPEVRNDENQLISQLHVLWLRLHNALLNTQIAANFEEAKELVVLTFQLIVIEEFLANIIDPKVMDHFMTFPSLPRFNLGQEDNIVPTFFSHAAFRFGHSMVRQEYSLKSRSSKGVNLKNLFKTNQKLSADHVVNWRHFFDYGERKSILAARIDTNISLPMRRVAFPQDTAFIDMITRNIQAGIDTGIPTGVNLCQSIIQNNQADKHFLALNCQALKDFGESKLANVILSNNRKLSINSLPLWPYILLESEQSSGDYLGVMTSILVMDVLKLAIVNAPISIIKNDSYQFDKVIMRMSNWGRDLTKIMKESPPQAPFKITMSNLIQLIQQMENHHV